MASELETHRVIADRLLDELLGGQASPDAAGELLRVAAARNALLCRAWSLVDRPEEATEAGLAIESALTSIQSALADAAADLFESGVPSYESLARLDSEVSFLTFAPVLELSEQFEIDLPIERTVRTVNASALAVELTLAPGWLAVRNDSQVVILAPAEYQADRAVGPVDWNIGTAARTIRIRNGDNWSVEAAMIIGRALLSVRGASESLGEVETGDGDSGQRLKFEDPGSGWISIVDVIVGPEFTYFFQTGCPATSGDCVTIANVVTSGAKLK